MFFFYLSFMRILVIGGTGFIGSYICKELLREGYSVRVFARSVSFEIERCIEGAEFCLGDLNDLTDAEYRSLFQNCSAVVFAAGVDDRKLTRLNVMEYYYHGNVVSSRRLVQLAGDAGIAKFLFIGSYFAHFERIWPHLRLAEWHPYIKSRKEQIEAVRASLPPSSDCSFLELPFVFGKVLSGKTLWEPLFIYLRSGLPVFAPRGGTAVVSVKWVARVARLVLEQSSGFSIRQISQENKSWKDLFRTLALVQGKKRNIYHLPAHLLDLGLISLEFCLKILGFQGGLKFSKLGQILRHELYLQPQDLQMSHEKPELPDSADFPVFDGM